MPITAWIDERHLPPLGLSNGWGYNPVAFMAPDPRLCPGGLLELAATVASSRADGIGVILDVVFNHTGESDATAPRSAARPRQRRLFPPRARRPPRQLLRHRQHPCLRPPGHPPPDPRLPPPLRRRAGIDGFRFDLAPVLGRTGPAASTRTPPSPRDRRRPAARRPRHDRRALGLGPGGYQLGGFPPTWPEWNDRYRDDVRRFWRGDADMPGELPPPSPAPPTSSRRRRARSVNFLAAHDGFTLADLGAYRESTTRRTARKTATATTRTSPGTTASRARPSTPRPRGAPPRPEGAARDALRLARHDHAHRRRRVRPHPARQQQRLRPGQPDHLARLGETATATSRPSPPPSPAAPAPRARDPRASDRRRRPDGIPDVAWLTPGGRAKTAADWKAARGPALPCCSARRRRPPRGTRQPQQPRGRLPPAGPPRPSLARRPRRPDHGRPPRRRLPRELPGHRPRGLVAPPPPP